MKTQQNMPRVNPGSPTLLRQTKRLGQVGILELTPSSTSAHIIELAKLRDS